MPARNGTGPFGTGPVGRRFGPCQGNEQETVYGQPFGMGMAHRRGRRFDNQPPRWETLTSIDEKQVLQNRQNWLQEQLAIISRRIEEISKT
jgi:hypothetical protein